ncbi:MAG: alpha/beta fold hydrolase [Thermomicrobiales bacterium]
MSTPRSGTTRFAQRDNARIAYDPGAWPDGSDAAPVVVLLHGLLADRNAFAAQREALADQFRVISPDARGHGASPSVANQWYSIAELAADIVAILDVEAIAAAHLIGHDLGGATAFEVARKHPARVRSLTLIEPAVASLVDNHPDGTAGAARNDLRATDRAAADDAYKGVIDLALDRYLRPRWGPGWKAEVTKPRLGAIRRNAGSLAGLLPALDGYTIHRSDAADVPAPTLVIAGDDATPLDRAICARLAEALPAGQHETVPFGSRPNGPLAGDVADRITDVIGTFLREGEVTAQG